MSLQTSLQLRSYPVSSRSVLLRHVPVDLRTRPVGPRPVPSFPAPRAIPKPLHSRSHVPIRPAPCRRAEYLAIHPPCRFGVRREPAGWPCRSSLLANGDVPSTRAGPIMLPMRLSAIPAGSNAFTSELRRTRLASMVSGSSTADRIALRMATSSQTSGASACMVASSRQLAVPIAPVDFDTSPLEVMGLVESPDIERMQSVRIVQHGQTGQSSVRIESAASEKLILSVGGDPHNRSLGFTDLAGRHSEWFAGNDSQSLINGSLKSPLGGVKPLQNGHGTYQI